MPPKTYLSNYSILWEKRCKFWKFSFVVGHPTEGGGWKNPQAKGGSIAEQRVDRRSRRTKGGISEVASKLAELKRRPQQNTPTNHGGVRVKAP